MSSRTRGIMLAFCIIGVFLLLRLLNLGHVLMWDEGRFMATLQAFSSWDSTSPFWYYTSFHPPLYLVVCLPFYRAFSSPGTVRALCEGVSLLASLGVMGLLYLIGRDLEGKRAGVLAALAFALMPAAAVLNVWVKEDSLCLFLSMLALFLYLRRRPWLSGACLGLAMLTKEFALSFALTIALFSLLTVNANTWRSKARELAIIYGLAALLSFWWYFFISNSLGHFMDFYTGGNYESLRFHQPWHYYLSGLWSDMGGILAISALAGVLFMCLRFLKGRDTGKLRTLAWALATFAPLFFSYGKPYWLIIMALPALALTAATGLTAFLDHLETRSSPRVASIALAIVLLAALAIPLYMDNAGYINSRNRYVPLGVTDYSYSNLSRDTAYYFNENWRAGDRLLGVFELANMPNPVFLFYSEHPDDLLQLDEEMGLAYQIIRDRPAWTFITDTERGRALRQEMSRYFRIEPERVGVGYAYPTYLLFSQQQR